MQLQRRNFNLEIKNLKENNNFFKPQLNQSPSQKVQFVQNFLNKKEDEFDSRKDFDSVIIRKSILSPFARKLQSNMNERKNQFLPDIDKKMKVKKIIVIKNDSLTREESRSVDEARQKQLSPGGYSRTYSIS